MFAEFREFVERGNMLDLAVGFVLGIAFQTVISTLVERVLTPTIALLFGEPNLDALLTFGPVDPETGVPAGSVGAVLTALLNLLLVGLGLFVVVKLHNRMRRAREAAEEAAEPDPEDVVLLREIRDALRQP